MTNTCPRCGSDHVRFHAKRGKQYRYQCKDCGKWYHLKEPIEPVSKVPVDVFAKQRILLIDIETAPTRAYAWSRWKQNIFQSQIISEGFMLCFSYKWLGEGHTSVDALPFYDLYQEDNENDYHVVKAIWELFNRADIIIAHNGDEFDIPFINSRFIFHGMGVPSPYRTVDTLKIARKYFRFPSNKLDDLGEYLKLGRKVETEGFALWTGCLSGNFESWTKMCEYNIGDVDLLEKIYLKLRAWDKSHPSISVLDNAAEERCTICGSTNLTEGDSSQNTYTNLSSFTSMLCNNCGHWNRRRTTHFGIEKRKSLLTNAR